MRVEATFSDHRSIGRTKCQVRVTLTADDIWPIYSSDDVPLPSRSVADCKPFQSGFFSRTVLQQLTGFQRVARSLCDSWAHCWRVEWKSGILSSGVYSQLAPTDAVVRQLDWFQLAHCWLARRHIIKHNWRQFGGHRHSPPPSPGGWLWFMGVHWRHTILADISATSRVFR